MQTVVCICEHDRMSDNESHSITITLSPTQVDDVVRAAAHGRAPSISTLIADSLAAPLAGTLEQNGAEATAETLARPLDGRGYMPIETSDPRMSRSLLRGLSLLAGFGPDGAERGIVELAEDLGMSPSTAHRYALTLVEVGLLERCPRTRKYRLPQR
jgi:IclR helix-turn-helix domain